jgi:hypothetical protein
MATPERRARFERIIERIIERSDADEIVWERGAPPQSWAVNIGDLRFRVRREGGEQLLYSLDIMGPDPETLVGAEWSSLLERFYRAAQANGERHTPDPLDTVESELGLD